MKKVIFSIATLLSLTAVFAFTLAQNWAIADGYKIRFSSADVGGIFRTFTGSVVFDANDLAGSKFDVSVDVASINTGNGLQNKHAKGEEWFDATKYPLIRYTSTSIVKAGNAYSVKGILEMHGVKKEMSIPFTFQSKGNAATFTGSFTVNRNDFKIGKPGGEVADNIKIDLTVPVVKK